MKRSESIRSATNTRKTVQMVRNHPASPFPTNTETNETMNRDAILKDCPEDFADELSSFIDSVERRVNSAFYLLDNIKSISDLDRVSECRNELNELSTDLY